MGGGPLARLAWGRGLFVAVLSLGEIPDAFAIWMRSAVLKVCFLAALLETAMMT